MFVIISVYEVNIMKRTIAIILLLTFSIYAFSSCTDPINAVSQPEMITSTEPVEDTSDTAEASADVIAEPVAVVESGFADYITSDDEKNDYIHAVTLYDENTLIALYSGRAEIYDIAKKELIIKQVFEGKDYFDICLTESGKIIYSNSNGGYSVFSSLESTEADTFREDIIVFLEYEEYEEYDDYDDPDEVSKEEFEYAEYYFMPDESYYCFKEKGVFTGKIGSEEEQVVLETPEQGDSARFLAKCGDELYISLTTDYKYTAVEVIDLNDGTVKAKAPSSDNYSKVYEGRVFEYAYSYPENVVTYLPGSASSTLLRFEGNDESIIYGSENGFVTYDDSIDDILTIRSYDIEGNMYFREEIDPEHIDTYVTDTTVFGNIYAFLINYSDEAEIDFESLAPDEEYDGYESEYIQFTRIYIYTNDNYEPIERGFTKTTQEIAEEFKEETGMKIYLDKTADRYFYDYNTELCTSRYLIIKCTEAIKDVIKAFPEGFFAELFDPEIDYTEECVEFYLVGSITGNGDNTISSAAAFTTNEDNKRIIVVDASNYYSDNLRNTIAHELMHAIDDYMLRIYEEEYFGNWLDYVPYNSYAYMYSDANGNDYYDSKYVIDGYGDTYFIDYYSKTYPWEDRARLFENMFFADKAEESKAFEYEHIALRAAYLARELRRCFNSIKDSEPTCWEQTLAGYLENAPELLYAEFD